MSSLLSHCSRPRLHAQTRFRTRTGVSSQTYRSTYARADSKKWDDVAVGMIDKYLGTSEFPSLHRILFAT